MKRLLGLLLVMGMVGCGEVKTGEVKTVDISKTVERGGLRYEINSETPFTGVGVEKYENGQKREQATFKDGKEVSKTEWDEEGNEIKE